MSTTKASYLHTEKSKARLKEIDGAAGIAIILVVLGHALDYAIEDFYILKNVIYKFHMPFFMMISGLLFYSSIPKIKNIVNYFKYVGDKLKKLGVTYLIISLIYLSIKTYLNAETNEFIILKNFMYILIKPTYGVSIFLWYIYVLMLFYLSFPLLFFLSFIKKNTIILILVGSLLYISPTFFYSFELNLFQDYFLFFSIGIFIAQHYSLFKRSICLYRFPFVFIFGFIFIIDLYFDSIPSIVFSLFSIFCLFSLAILLSKLKQLQYIGLRRYVIYVWHSIFLFSSSLILKKIDSNFTAHFIYYIPLYLGIGILGPITIRHLTRKYKLKFLHRIIP